MGSVLKVTVPGQHGDAQSVRPAFAWLPALLLGLATVGAYGTVYYSIGVLLPVIAADTGWSTGLLAGGVSLGVLGQGGIALIAGRMLDRGKSRSVLLVAALAGGLFLSLSSFASEAWQFAISWGLGAALAGGGLYYNATMPLTALLYRARRASAFSILTLLGALASPIFYPLASISIETWDWQGALRALVALMVLCVLPAALVVQVPHLPRGASTSLLSGLRTAFHESPVRRVLLVLALASLGNSALLLHQVPAMQATGLSLAHASWLAGARGALQIPGRLFLSPLIARVGVRNALRFCYGLAATGICSLAISLGGTGAIALTAFFCVATGLALGLLSPLNGLLQSEVFGDARLGMLSGVTVLIVSVCGAAGTMISGTLVEVTGSYELVLVLVMFCQILALFGLSDRRSTGDTGGVVLPEPSASGPG